MANCTSLTSEAFWVSEVTFASDILRKTRDRARSLVAKIARHAKKQWPRCLIINFSLLLMNPIALAEVSGGARVMENPIYVNVYWDNNWDSNMSAVALGSRASIDDFTRTLIGSSYFFKLNQYGVHGASFGGSVVMSSASPASVSRTDIANFVRGGHPSGKTKRAG